MSDAVLVWQDVPGMIDNVGLTRDKKSITFDVKPENIMQGNAILAVRNGTGDIMWSWHIWVTDYVLGEDLDMITNADNETFALLPYAIGWCDQEYVVYNRRVVKVKFIQEDTGENRIVEFIQAAGQETNCSNQVYFQWGRKDPILGGNVRVGSTDYRSKQCYADDDAYLYTAVKGTSTLENAIRRPQVQFCNGEGNWCAKNYRNLWNVNNTTFDLLGTSVTKTVYDPSPAGFTVAPSKTFTGFTVIGGNSTDINSFRVLGEYDWGWNFLCDGSESSPTSYFAASGYRALSDGTIKALGVRGYVWTATPKDNALAYSLFYSNTNVSPVYNKFEKSYSFPVRPCKEF